METDAYSVCCDKEGRINVTRPLLPRCVISDLMDNQWGTVRKVALLDGLTLQTLNGLPI